ncbi:hypothetical protein, partial [Burkholderia mallei]|uniref:hypothetical protein n=1 Tax=Burkholderia mallei TaxID=13373 RepID=UPI001E455B42
SKRRRRPATPRRRKNGASRTGPHADSRQQASGFARAARKKEAPFCRATSRQRGRSRTSAHEKTRWFQRVQIADKPSPSGDFCFLMA